MKLADFDYHLPKELIAQYPLKQREAAKLLALTRSRGSIEHCRAFTNFPEYLKKGDLLVLNNTRVLPSWLTARRSSGGRVEILLLNHKQDMVFSALISGARVKSGEKIKIDGNGLLCEVRQKNEVAFDCREINEVYKLGRMPLPPYIKREPDEQDNVYYQTVYAQKDGSVASPTAGLHFSQGLLDGLREQGVNIAYVTLHVGLGTFKPVKSEDVAGHKMEMERFILPEETLRALEEARKKQGRVIAVGTTSCRVLETYAATGLREGETGLFIYPGYEFKSIDGLITNFHLPRTTLFMLTCAFGGEALVKKAYQEAIEQKYRFYSYGDAMLII